MLSLDYICDWTLSPPVAVSIFLGRMSLITATMLMSFDMEVGACYCGT